MNGAGVLATMQAVSSFFSVWASRIVDGTNRSKSGRNPLLNPEEDPYSGSSISPLRTEFTEGTLFAGTIVAVRTPIRAAAVSRPNSRVPAAFRADDGTGQMKTIRPTNQPPMQSCLTLARVANLAKSRASRRKLRRFVRSGEHARTYPGGSHG